MLRNKHAKHYNIFRLPCPPLAKRGSLTHTQALALSKRARDVTALRCSEPLRYKVGGPSKVFARLRGMGPPGDKIFIVIMHSVFIGIVFYCLQIGNFIFMAYRIISYVYKFRITETYIEALKNCSCFF